MYVKVENGVAQPYKISQLRKEYPNVSFPSVIPDSLFEEYSIYPVVETTPPSYDANTQKVTDYYEQSAEGLWERKWSVVDKSAQETQSRLIQKAAKHRYQKETSGITWTDTSGDTWFLDTSLDSQARLTGAASAVSRGLRVDGDVWKCAKVIDAETYNLAYRPTTNAEIETWANLVHQHVQKCFTAESNAVAKVMAGDYTSSFEQEFLAL